MDVETWLAAAKADADRRGLAALKPILETLAASTRALRAGAKIEGQPGARSEDPRPEDGGVNDR
jgi:hypothetical protein